MITIPKALAIRPKPYTTESVLGYWARLAQLNSIALPRLMSVLPPQYPEMQCSENMSQLSVWAAQLMHSPRAVSPRWVLANSVRWCPLCLQDNEHWRAEWELAMVSTCAIHRSRLVDRCPNCESAVYWRGLNLKRCLCGWRLSASKHIVQADLSAVESAILSSIYPEQFSRQDTTPPYYLRPMNNDQLHRFVLFIGCWDLPKRKPPYKTDIGWAIAAASKVERTIADWPNSYFSILDHQRATHPNESRLIRQLGFFYRAVYKEFREPEFTFLRDATETYLSERWPGTLDQRHRHIRLSAVAKNQNVSQTRLSKDAHVPARFIRRWLQDEKIDGQSFHLPTGRTRATIRADEISKVAALRNHIYLNQAADALHLPERRVVELIRSGLLYGAAPSAGERWLIPHGEIERLRRQLNAIEMLDDADSLTWDQIFRYRMAPQIAFGALVSAIFAGDIRVVRSCRGRTILGFADFSVEGDSLKRWIASTTDGIALPALQSLLGIKQEVIYHLADREIIQTKSCGRLGRRVSIEEIERFKAVYVTGAELAKVWKTSPRKVDSTLTQSGVQPISGPKADGGRQNIFLREQVKKFSIDRDA